MAPSPRRGSRVLFDEPPVGVSPKAVRLFGANAALVLQQLHYWTSCHQGDQGKFLADGSGPWLRESAASLSRQTGLKPRTVNDVLNRLIETGAVVCAEIARGQNRTLSYRVAYNVLYAGEPEEAPAQSHERIPPMHERIPLMQERDSPVDERIPPILNKEETSSQTSIQTSDQKTKAAASPAAVVSAPAPRREAKVEPDAPLAADLGSEPVTDAEADAAGFAFYDGPLTLAAWCVEVLGRPYAAPALEPKPLTPHQQWFALACEFGGQDPTAEMPKGMRTRFGAEAKVLDDLASTQGASEAEIRKRFAIMIARNGPTWTVRALAAHWPDFEKAVTKPGGGKGIVPTPPANGSFATSKRLAAMGFATQTLDVRRKLQLLKERGEDMADAERVAELLRAEGIVPAA